MIVIFLLDVLIWFVLHMMIVYICHKMSDNWYLKNDSLFRLFRFEKQGRFYVSFWKIKKWKDILPDGGKINRYGFEKSKIEKNTLFLRKFYLETKRAELIHVAGIVSSVVFLLLHSFPTNIIVFMIAIILDVPFIMIQRYNRPRLGRLIDKMEGRNET